MSNFNESDQLKVLVVKLCDQQFGVPVTLIRDIFKPNNLTEVPLSSPEVWGVVNLRGRIVTAIDLRTLLALPARNENEKFMMVALEYETELFSIVVDSVQEVIDLKAEFLESNPSTLVDRLKEMSQGIYKLENELLCILDLKKIIAISTKNCTGEVA